MKYHALFLFCLNVVVSYAADTLTASPGQTYFVGDEHPIIFLAEKCNTLNKNSDTEISAYIDKLRSRKSHQAYTYNSISLTKNDFLLFFWKNKGKNEWGFVVAEKTRTGVWQARLNGQKTWASIQPGEEETFRWFTEGRSVGVTLISNHPQELTYFFAGDIDY